MFSCCIAANSSDIVVDTAKGGVARGETSSPPALMSPRMRREPDRHLPPFLYAMANQHVSSIDV